MTFSNLRPFASAIAFTLLTGSAFAESGPAPSHIGYDASDKNLVFCRAPATTHVSYDVVEKHIVLTVESAYGTAGSNGTSLSEGQCGKVKATPGQTKFHQSYSASISAEVASYATIFMTTMQNCLSSPGMMLVFDDSFENPVTPVHCVPWKGKPARALRATRD
ncbi:MAG: hypothetical protein AAFQ24_13780 [Pseudomonadota bacterium]